MSTKTTHLNLTKPELSEYYDIKVFNSNADLVDSAIGNLQDNVESRVGAYTWYIDTDDVRDKSAASVGSLSDCMTDDFIGTWFYVRTTSSESGSAAYPSTYEIDGANGYLSLRDYVIWTGAHLVHVSTYEAKASTVKNSDGKYSPKSGVDGLMSSTDKAYLTDLIDAYWNTKIDNTTYNANECLENGLYAPVTLGRPSGVSSDERLGVWVIKDKTNGGVVQIAISFNVVGRMWMRSSATNSADGFSEWKPVLSGDTVMPLFLRDNNGGNLPNWLIKTGVYHGIKDGAGGSPADFFGSENTTNWTIVVTVDPDDSTHVTQRAYNNEDSSEIAMRQGTGTGGASMWGDWESVGGSGIKKLVTISDGTVADYDANTIYNINMDLSSESSGVKLPVMTSGTGLEITFVRLASGCPYAAIFSNDGESISTVILNEFNTIKTVTVIYTGSGYTVCE